jgi:hypothetical protein
MISPKSVSCDGETVAVPLPVGESPLRQRLVRLPGDLFEDGQLRPQPGLPHRSRGALAQHALDDFAAFCATPPARQGNRQSTGDVRGVAVARAGESGPGQRFRLVVEHEQP